MGLIKLVLVVMTMAVAVVGQGTFGFQGFEAEEKQVVCGEGEDYTDCGE